MVSKDNLSGGAARSEETGDEVGRLAAIGLNSPQLLTYDQIKTVCASALTQRPSAKFVEPSDDETAIREQVALIAEAAAEIKRILR